MIPRYSRDEMASIWSDENRYSVWLEVELLALREMASLGMVPQGVYEEVSKKAAFETARVSEIEAEVRHDVIAFLTCVSEHAGPSAAYLHKGMTSSDLLDTAFAVQLGRAGDLLLKGLDSLLDAVRKRAEEHRFTACMGRSHGIHAEPLTFGLKLLNWYSEFRRDRDRLQNAIEGVKVGKISGAVGTFASLDPRVEEGVMAALGLRCEPVATQIVARDRHAAFFQALAILGTTIERCAVEIRHLQRTEVGEVQEEFAKGQKGSSAMPHKRNPILSENLSGLARLLRSYAQASLENMVLWHERDISHSSVERIIAPDACILADFMMARFTNLVLNMRVDTERMRSNLEMSRGLIFSGSLLLLLVEGGFTREEAYRLVQAHALAAWDAPPGLRDRVESDPEIMNRISPEQLNEVFEINRHFAHVDYIFRRTLD